MKISDFSNDEFIESIKIYSPSFKQKYVNESLDPISVIETQRTDLSVSIITTQLFMSEYPMHRVFKFTNSPNDSIKVEIIEVENQKTSLIDVTENFLPIFRMITKDNSQKGNDWLSRLTYNELLYLTNKYASDCSSIMFECNEKFRDHCRKISLKDEFDFYLYTVVFGDYSLKYAGHDNTITKLNQKNVFSPEDLELYYLITKRLDEADKPIYTKEFIDAHMHAYSKFHSDKDFYQHEIEKANRTAKQLLSWATKTTQPTTQKPDKNKNL